MLTLLIFVSGMGLGFAATAAIWLVWLEKQEAKDL